jgi:hypothetical protein
MALRVTRAQILAFRRRVGALDERLPKGRRSLRQAAYAGLQDSMPRAALLSIHARVDGATPSSWEDPSLVQVWGPRYQVYVVAAPDLAVFTLARLPDAGKIRNRAVDLAERLHVFLDGERMRYDDAGQALGVHGNMLRYAALTGRLAIRWEGARRPLVWTVPPPDISREEATRELARRFLHVYGPAKPGAFGSWAGIGAATAVRAFDELGGELVPVRTPPGDAFMLASDEACDARASGTHGRARPAAERGRLHLARPRTRTVRSSCRMRDNAASCGRRASGPARSSSQARSSAPGAARSGR